MNYYTFSIFPFILLEVLASVLFVMSFGFGNFVLFLFGSMLIGVVLLAIFWRNMLEFRFCSPLEMLKNFAFVISGFLFLVPGLLSSVCGLFVLVFGLVFGFSRQNAGKFTQNSPQNDEIIDVEIIDEKKDKQ